MSTITRRLIAAIAFVAVATLIGFATAPTVTGLVAGPGGCCP